MIGGCGVGRQRVGDPDSRRLRGGGGRGVCTAGRAFRRRGAGAATRTRSRAAGCSGEQYAAHPAAVGACPSRAYYIKTRVAQLIHSSTRLLGTEVHGQRLEGAVRVVRSRLPFQAQKFRQAAGGLRPGRRPRLTRTRQRRTAPPGGKPPECGRRAAPGVRSRQLHGVPGRLVRPAGACPSRPAPSPWPGSATARRSESAGPHPAAARAAARALARASAPAATCGARRVCVGAREGGLGRRLHSWAGEQAADRSGQSLWLFSIGPYLI